VEHRRFTVATLHAGPVQLPLLHAQLLVVRHDGGEDLDWECVAFTLPTDPHDKVPLRLRMDVVEGGRSLSGDAVVVRSDERRHVFRGVGALEGLRAGDLPRPGAGGGGDHR
jgi:hypothetical protein